MKQLVIKVYFIFVFLITTIVIFAQKFLVISTYNPTYPCSAQFNRGLKEIAEQSDGKIDLFFEDLDITRFNGETHKQNFAQYLSNKYANYSIGRTPFNKYCASRIFRNCTSIYKY